MSSLSMFRRAAAAQEIARCLYRVTTGQDDAELTDAPIAERADYREIAELAVEMAADLSGESGRTRGALYSATAAYLFETYGPSLDGMSLSRRHHATETMRLAVDRFIALMRGAWPADMEHYTELAANDYARIVAIRLEREADEPESSSLSGRAS